MSIKEIVPIPNQNNVNAAEEKFVAVSPGVSAPAEGRYMKTGRPRENQKKSGGDCAVHFESYPG